MENCQQNVSKNPENSKKHWNKQDYHTRYLFRRNGKPQYIGIRIEIKSPRECEHLSLKAIRQAVENKIVLLSRKTYPTTEDCSSYAVGYYTPNDRAEIVALINDIKSTYGYNIAVFDIESLVKITVNIVLFNKGIDIKELYRLEGIVDVKDFKSEYYTKQYLYS